MMRIDPTSPSNQPSSHPSASVLIEELNKYAQDLQNAIASKNAEATKQAYQNVQNVYAELTHLISPSSVDMQGINYYLNDAGNHINGDMNWSDLAHDAWQISYYASGLS